MYKDNTLKLFGDSKNSTHKIPIQAPFVDTMHPILTFYMLSRSFFFSSFILEYVVYNVNVLKPPGDGQNPTNNVLIEAPFVDTMSPISTIWVLLNTLFLGLYFFQGKGAGLESVIYMTC